MEYDLMTTDANYARLADSGLTYTGRNPGYPRVIAGSCGVVTQ